MISVIIPTYNRDKLLKRAINSVISQTRQPCEIIVVDDGSDFDVKKYLAQFYDSSIVKVIVNGKNVGGSASRNIGAAQAQGEWIAFLDSDDYWSPQKLEQQTKIAEQYPDVALIYCDQWIVDRRGGIHKPQRELIDNNNLWDFLLQGWTAPNTSTLVFKKKIFLELGGFDTNLTSCQDHDLWMKIASAAVPVRFVPEHLSYFTNDAENRISFSYENRIGGAITFLEKWKSQIVGARGDKHYRWFKDDYMNKVVFPIALTLFRNRQFSSAFKLYWQYLAFNPVFYTKTTELGYNKFFIKRNINDA